MKKQNCYLQEFGYERFERVIEMIGGKWKLETAYNLYAGFARSFTIWRIEETANACDS